MLHRFRTFCSILLVAALAAAARAGTSDSAVARVRAFVPPRVTVTPDVQRVRLSVAAGDAPEAELRYHVRTNVRALDLSVAATALQHETGPRTIPLDEDAGVEIRPERAIPRAGAPGPAEFTADDEVDGRPARRSRTIRVETPPRGPLSQDVTVRLRWRRDPAAPRGRYTATVRLIAMPSP